MPSPLKKNETAVLSVEGLTSDGLGVGHINGQAVFVKGGAPGDLAEIVIVKSGATLAYGRIRRLLAPSSLRAESDCPVYPRCGGCQTRHLSYEAELAYKKTKVEDAFRRIGGFSLSCEEIVGDPRPDRCRCKAMLPVGMGKEGPIAGFYRERSHEIIPVRDCLLQKECVARASDALLSYMKEEHVPPYDEESGEGLIRRLFVRSSEKTGKALLTVVAAGDTLPAREKLIKTLRKACPEASGIVLNVHTGKGNAVLGPRCIPLWGDLRIEDTLAGLSFRISPLSFFQVNPLQADRLYGLAADFAGLTGKEKVLDLYCGAGTITLALAKRAAFAVGAEIVAPAVEDAWENARQNGITNVRFLNLDAGQAAEVLEKEGYRPDVLSVDPPRKGLSSETADAILRLSPDRIVYVSCDPATLARDSARLFSGGYTPVRLSAVDLFPRTAHVETVCLLSKRSDESS